MGIMEFERGSPTHEEMKEVAPAIGYLLERITRDLCEVTI